eukprot:739101-Amphidinium_carterae.1
MHRKSFHMFWGRHGQDLPPANWIPRLSCPSCRMEQLLQWSIVELATCFCHSRFFPDKIGEKENTSSQ